MVILRLMSQNNRDFEPLSPRYVENTGSRTPAVGPMGARGQKDLEKKLWNLTENHQKRKKIELTIKMCGISSEIAWQLFFRFWTHFDPLLAILLVPGNRAYIGEPGQKDLAKIWNLTEKSSKTKKIELIIKMCRISPGIPRQPFFRFWTRFDPLLAILLVPGNKAYVGEPG